jgi:hypothetical protein
MLDKQLMAGQVFKLAVTDYSKEISDSELKSSNGGALARYISKPIGLADGFESTGIQVKLDVNRKIGTDIEVFCRVLAKDDKSLSNGIYDRPWVRVPLKTPAAKTFAGTTSKFFTEIYSILEPELNYTSVTTTGVSATFKDFSFYQIKVVFYTNNPVYMPTIKSLSATSLV